MKFTKMHGLGNDYIYFNCFEEKIDDPAELSIRLSDRHFGVGSDGIVLIMPSEVADFRMRMFNADGSEGKMCGNASRCIGKFVYENALTDKTTITLETLGGIRTLELEVEGKEVKSVTVDMGVASFKAAEVPAVAEKQEIVDEPIHMCGREWKMTCVSVGNPHCVIFTQGIEDMRLEEIGPQFENCEIFPERINTEFVEVIDSHCLKMRVWERGSGETMACGTGATATVAAAIKNGRSPVGEFITVKLLGGDLQIMQRPDGSMLMKGTATTVFEGYID